MAPTETRGAKGILTQARTIEFIQRWNALFGAPPRAADLNPSSARWAAQTWRIERYKRGDPETGEPWPSLNAVKKLFNGSLNEAVRAAGLEPGKPGPSRRSNVNLDHARNLMPPDGKVALDGLRARVLELERKLDVRERELERARGIARDRPLKHSTVIKERVRTEKVKVIDHAAVNRAEKLASEARSAAYEAKGALRAAGVTSRAEIRRVGLLLSRRDEALARARLERKELTVRIKELEGKLANALAEPVQVERLKTVFVDRDPPAQVELDGMRRERDQALRHAQDCEVLQARSDASYLELASAVKGEARRLSHAEVVGLREKGPAGPVVVADALRLLARARKTNRPDLLDAALLKLAAAAINWRERL